MKNIKFLLKVLGTTILTAGNLTTIVGCDCNSVSSLSSVLKVTNLNSIYIGSKDIPVTNLIAKAIKEQNADVDTNAITISNISATSAKVTGNKNIVVLWMLVLQSPTFN